MRSHYEKKFCFANGKWLSRKKPGVFVAVLLVLLVLWLLGQMLEEVNDSSLILLFSAVRVLCP